MIVPDSVARQRLLEERSTRLRRAMQARITEHRVETGRLAQAFGDPRLLIASAQQRVDEHVMRLGRILSKRLEREKDAVSRLGARLGAAHPRERIARDRARASELEARLGTIARAELRDRGDRIRVLTSRLDGLAPHIVRSRVDGARTLAARLDTIGPKLVRDRADRISGLAGRLDAMSPLKVLARAYAIVTRTDGRAVRDAGEVEAGDALHVRVASGSFEAQVTDVGPQPRPAAPERRAERELEDAPSSASRTGESSDGESSEEDA
jgi:exodeoxyribonuclease VII large subunit